MNPFIPVDQVLLDATLSVFKKVSHVTLGFAGFVFAAQIAVLAVSMAGVQAYARVFRDISLLFVATQLCPSVLQILIKSVGDIASHISYAEMPHPKGAVEQLFEVVKNSVPILGFSSEILSMSLPYMARAVYAVLLALLCSIAPVVLLVGLVTGIGGAAQGLFQSLIAMAIWPIVWNSIGLLAHEIWPSFAQTSLASVCFWIVVSVVQLLSPLFCIHFFRNLSPGAAIGTALPVQIATRAVMP